MLRGSSLLEKEKIMNDLKDLIEQDILNIKSLKSLELNLNYRLILLNSILHYIINLREEFKVGLIAQILNKIDFALLNSFKITICMSFQNNDLISLFTKYNLFPNLETFHFSISKSDVEIVFSDLLFLKLFDFIQSTQHLKTLSLRLL